jgi:hypothetical protein
MERRIPRRHNRCYSIPARGACIYGIVLMKNNRLDEAENILRSYIQQHGEEGYLLTKSRQSLFGSQRDSEGRGDAVARA